MRREGIAFSSLFYSSTLLLIIIIQSCNSRLRFYICLQFRLRLFSTTDTEEHAIAALAIIGLSNMPYDGKSIPAAIGIPITL